MFRKADVRKARVHEKRGLVKDAMDTVGVVAQDVYEQVQLEREQDAQESRAPGRSRGR